MSQKIFSTILLSADGCYLCDNELPSRIKGDKQFLRAMLTDEIISVRAYKLLPKSIRSVVKSVTNETEPTTGVSIDEIDALTDILIVIRSGKKCEGDCKKFRMDKFELLIRSGQIEIYQRRKNV